MSNEETWIKRELTKRGMTGRRFADAIGCSPTHASRLIAGVDRPSVKLCRRIAAVFRVTEQEVMRQTGRLSPLPDDYDKAQEQELKEIMQGLPYSSRKTLVEFAQFLFRRRENEDEGA
jgi:transcriptional regulator with XRE-family HTH domain